MLKKILGISLIIISIIFGIYLGGWGMFVGGCLHIAKAFDMHMISAVLIVTNVLKILFGGIVGAFIILFGVSGGLAIIEN